jgi:hypothetical protein
MTPEEIAITEWKISSEKGLRAELWVHGYEPSPVIKKEILINMLTQVYFGE